MVAVVALADYQYDIVTAIGTAVHTHRVYSSDKFIHLLSRETVGIYAEHEPVQGKIQYSLVLACKLVFHATDVLARHEAYHGFLVLHTFRCRIYKQCQSHSSHDRNDGTCRSSDNNHPRVTAHKPSAAIKETRRHVGTGNMYQSDKHNPAHLAEDNIKTKV